VEACAIRTTEANELVRPAHDRMPVILDPRHYAEWLDPSLTDPTRFADWLRPYPAGAMTASLDAARSRPAARYRPLPPLTSCSLKVCSRQGPAQ